MVIASGHGIVIPQTQAAINESKQHSERTLELREGDEAETTTLVSTTSFLKPLTNPSTPTEVQQKPVQ